MQQLEQLVARLLKEHGGGEPYFDNFDAEMRRAEHESIVRRLFDFAGDIVASGRFGRYLYELRLEGRLSFVGNFVLASGSLRKGAQAEVLFQASQPRGGFTFVDDSYYSGTTERRVRETLHMLGAEVTRTRVIYDGSPVQAPGVEALYRYYDHHAHA